MKLLLAFTILTIAAVTTYGRDSIELSEEQRKLVLEYAAVCSEQHSVDKAAVQALRSGQFEKADQKVKCFTNCFMEKAGLLVDGQVQKDAVSTKLSGIFGKDKVNAAIAQCNNLKGGDNCETAFELYKCFFKVNAATI